MSPTSSARRTARETESRDAESRRGEWGVPNSVRGGERRRRDEKGMRSSSPPPRLFIRPENAEIARTCKLPTHGPCPCHHVLRRPPPTCPSRGSIVLLAWTRPSRRVREYDQRDLLRQADPHAWSDGGVMGRKWARSLSRLTCFGGGRLGGLVEARTDVLACFCEFCIAVCSSRHYIDQSKTGTYIWGPFSSLHWLRTRSVGVAAAWHRQWNSR